MRFDKVEGWTGSDETRTAMRVVRGLRAIALIGVIAGIGLIAAGTEATPRVVGDEACPYYAVDIAAFATCEDDTVAGSPSVDVAEATGPALLEPGQQQENARSAERGASTEPAPRRSPRAAAES